MAYDKMSDAQKRQSGMKIPESPTKPMMEKKKTMKKKKAVAKKATKKTGELTAAQLKKLANHKQHTKQHLDSMKAMMLSGKSFDASHIATVKMVGN